MCIIVDPPLFKPLFSNEHKDHTKYAPVKQWIDKPDGKLVMGGTQYNAELANIGSILKILTEYEKAGKIIRKNKSMVDREIVAVKKVEPSRDFDDHHLVALTRLTGCRLICINDPRSHKYLTDKKFYNSPKDRPKLYTRANNAALLCEKNFAPCCK